MTAGDSVGGAVGSDRTNDLCGCSDLIAPHPRRQGCPPAGIGYVPAVIPPDPERDKRVAFRRAENARRAGLALDRLLGPDPLRDAYARGWRDGYAESEAHHNGHYDVSLPTGGEMPNCCPSTTDACELGSCPRRNSPAWRSAVER